MVDGLALIGTQAEVQRSAAPDQLQQVLADLRALAADAAFQGCLVTLVIGENGLDLARQQGLGPVLKVGNWVGPVLVAAAEAGVRDLLLLGYHGKLIKLAGGIFHTHHHLADGRLEVLVALGLDAGLCRWPSCCNCAVLHPLRRPFRHWRPIKPALALGQHLAAIVERRSQSYVDRYGAWSMRIGAALFDRSRTLRWWGPEGEKRFFTLRD